MKVYDQNLTGAAAAEAGRSQETKRTERTNSVPQANSTPGDRVELSGTLSSLSSALSSFGASHGARVQALAAQYQAGAYHADSLATSRSMVAEALSASSDSGGTP
jgi:hypothetical protein